MPINTFTNAIGEHPKMKNAPYAAFIMVPKASEGKAAEVAKFLDWMVNPEVILTLQNGIEGETYTMEENGIPRWIETREANQILYNYADYFILINGKIHRRPYLRILLSRNSRNSQ